MTRKRPHQIRADLLISCLSGEYRQSAGRRPRQTGSFPGRWGKTSALLASSKKQRENTAALGSRHRRVCLVMSSARPRINLMFLSSPTRGSAEMAAAGYRRHRHGIISRMRYMQVIQYSSCIVVRILSGRISYTVGFDYYLGKASRLSSAERGTSGTAPVRGTSRRNQVLSGSGGSGNRQAGQAGRTGGSSCCCCRDPIPHSTAARGDDDPLMRKSFPFWFH